MNDPLVAINIHKTNGRGHITRPALTEPVDELSCDECGKPVGNVSDPDGGATFRPYHITTPNRIPVILCDDDAR